MKEKSRLGRDLSFRDFHAPDEVSAAPELARDEKIRILEEWERELNRNATAPALVLAEDVRFILNDMRTTEGAITGLSGERSDG